MDFKQRNKSGINASVGRPRTAVHHSNGSGANKRSSGISRQKAEDMRRDRIRRGVVSRPSTRQAPQSVYDDVKRQFGDVTSEVKRLKSSISLPSRAASGSSGGGLLSKFRRKKRSSLGKKILIAVIVILAINFLIFVGAKK